MLCVTLPLVAGISADVGAEAGQAESVAAPWRLRTSSAHRTRRVAESRRVASPHQAFPGAAPQLAILDIPDEGGFYVYEEEGAVDADSIASFVAKYKAGGLERKQLG